jgi:methylthioribulose-1-phosphate dehydratase
MGGNLKFFTEPAIFEHEQPDARRAAHELAEAGAEFHRLGWVPASTGNFSARVAEDPLRVLITRKIVSKAALRTSDFVLVDQTGAVTNGAGCPSAETAIHLAIMRSTGAGAVLHTHSIHDVLISERHAAAGGVSFSGFEVLKALKGVHSHKHREWVPILENAQDYRYFSAQVEANLTRYPESHGFLVRAHGLYSWGADIAEAQRHIEAFEFLEEVIVRL